jgi:hypothetical protein
VTFADGSLLLTVQHIDKALLSLFALEGVYGKPDDLFQHTHIPS